SRPPEARNAPRFRCRYKSHFESGHELEYHISHMQAVARQVVDRRRPFDSGGPCDASEERRAGKVPGVELSGPRQLPTRRLVWGLAVSVLVPRFRVYE